MKAWQAGYPLSLYSHWAHQIARILQVRHMAVVRYWDYWQADSLDTASD